MGRWLVHLLFLFASVFMWNEVHYEICSYISVKKRQYTFNSRTDLFLDKKPMVSYRFHAVIFFQERSRITGICLMDFLQASCELHRRAFSADWIIWVSTRSWMRTIISSLVLHLQKFMKCFRCSQADWWKTLWCRTDRVRCGTYIQIGNCIFGKTRKSYAAIRCDPW